MFFCRDLDELDFPYNTTHGPTNRVIIQLMSRKLHNIFLGTSHGYCEVSI